MTRSHFSSFGLSLGLLLVCAGSARAASTDVLVQSATSGGTPENSKPYLEQFVAYAQKSLKGWKPITAVFFQEKKGADQMMIDKKPGFAMLDIDAFLELRKREELVVLAQVEGPLYQLGHLHVVVKDPALKTLEDLKGKVVVSNHLGSPRFLQKVVFDGKIDPATFFQLQPTTSPMKGLKAVDRGEAAATIVDDQQLANMKTLPFGAEMKTIFSSAALPPTPFVALGKNAQPEERIAMQKMVLAMCGDKKGGAEVCKAFQITKFEKPNAAVFNEAIKRFDR
jgi:ABC-type phosphate/phosphonate transport system substrate-binding protein